MPFLTPRSKNTVLDASGNGQVTFEIDNTNQRWVLDTVVVQVVEEDGVTIVTAAPIPVANTYLNQVSASGWRGGTQSGNQDQAAGRAILYTGDVLYVVWSGGVPGKTANATIDGTFDPAGMKLSS
jgi:hypothetical protein